MEHKVTTTDDGEEASSSSKSKAEQSPDEGEDEDLRNVPPYFNSYSIQDMDIFCQKAKRIMDIYDNHVYERPAKVKRS